MAAQLASLDPVCTAEFKSMIAKAPRMTMGTTKFTANEIGMRYELEIENSLAAGLAALVSDTPAADEGDYLLSASLALHVGKLRNFVLEKVNSIVASPYQCEQFQQLNQSAGELVTQLNIPMPPMVNNLQGMRFRVDDFDPAMDLLKGNGLVALHVDKPEMFVGMASMMIPGFEDLDLANESEPVRIPPDMTQMEGLDVFVLMSDNAIGASIGEQHAKDLKGFMAVKTQNNGTFLSLSYDMARQMEMQAALTDSLYVIPVDDPSSIYHFSEAVRQSYIDMLGRSRVDMRMTGTGLVIDSEVTFK
jgi:hypothetical protein